MPKDVLRTNTLFILASLEDWSSIVFLRFFEPLKCLTLDSALFTRVKYQVCTLISFWNNENVVFSGLRWKSMLDGYHVSHEVANGPQHVHNTTVGY